MQQRLGCAEVAASTLNWPGDFLASIPLLRGPAFVHRGRLPFTDRDVGFPVLARGSVVGQRIGGTRGIDTSIGTGRPRRPHRFVLLLGEVSAAQRLLPGENAWRDGAGLDTTIVSVGLLALVAVGVFARLSVTLSSFARFSGTHPPSGGGRKCSICGGFPSLERLAARARGLAPQRSASPTRWSERPSCQHLRGQHLESVALQPSRSTLRAFMVAKRGLAAIEVHGVWCVRATWWRAGRAFIFTEQVPEEFRSGPRRKA